jgi:hypothetical protein
MDAGDNTSQENPLVKELSQKLLDPKQTGKVLKKSVGTLRRWRRLRIGPPHAQIGRGIYYHADLLDAYVRAEGRRTR